jgi:hypothetical protein
MWSTGGLDSTKQWEFRSSIGKGSLCHMCHTNLLKLIPANDDLDAFPIDSAEEQALAAHLKSVLEATTFDSPAPVVSQLSPQVSHDRQLVLV